MHQEENKALQIFQLNMGVCFSLTWDKLLGFMSKPGGAGCFLTESVMRFVIGLKPKPKVSRCSPTWFKGKIHYCFMTMKMNSWILQCWSGRSWVFAPVKHKKETEAELELSCWLGISDMFFNRKCGVWLLVHSSNSFHSQWWKLGDKGLL